MSTLTLPRIGWGDEHSTRHALIVHGLGSSAHTGWYIGSGLAEAGWYATAVDLRGHGSAPRAPRYRISDFAADLSETRPAHGGAWDVVIGHSIGAAASVVAQSTSPRWARKLILLDPALALTAERKELVRTGQLYGHDELTEAEVARDNPHWHPLDVELRVRSTRQASRFALEAAVADNPDWDVTEQAAQVNVSTLILGGDPAVDSMFTGDHAAAVLESNPLMSHVVIAGAGHSVHRDRPEETLSQIVRALV
ncbi:alpha/beta hydrolase [Pontimonas sp.]|jgi:pimeloyl-ACP methyl ester carboxylesterase|uniref:alpha/beta fold hydrolase n=1 Tax=Pontimonas sp. TaxID=2304492 RepID=UPI0028707E35|nr:alpha/beta hydrolase [Pontimonas sp.]MDR9396266.1 alpha/beta hydrolase [Pontimonas sp.]MDR9434649.1 alpha/beta hydrolase [Pontimonas sp.]